MAEPLTVGKLVHARMFGHTVETEILEKRIVERGRVEVRLKVPTEIVKEIRREARPGSHAWKAAEAFWVRESNLL